MQNSKYTKILGYLVSFYVTMAIFLVTLFMIK